MNVDSILKLDESSTWEALKYLENTGRSVMWVGQSPGQRQHSLEAHASQGARDGLKKGSGRPRCYQLP